MSRGRKERTPAQLADLAQAREKAKIVIAKRAKLNALAKKDEPQPETEPEAPPPPRRGIVRAGLCRTRGVCRNIWGNGGIPHPSVLDTKTRIYYYPKLSYKY